MAKARCKLFVVHQRTTVDVERLITSLQAMVRHFKVSLPGERHVLAGYSGADAAFRYVSVIVPSER